MSRAAGVKDGFFSVDVAKGRDSVDARVAAAIRQMSEKLGSSDDAIDEEIDAEISLSKVRRTLDGLAQAGISVSGLRILDLGAGLGALSLEASRRGAAVVALEPGEGWREIAAERLKNEGTGAAVVAAGGERLPFGDGAFDGVISLQVLEHVRDPEATLREVFRVLKPGGFLWLTAKTICPFASLTTASSGCRCCRSRLAPSTFGRAGGRRSFSSHRSRTRRSRGCGAF